MKITVTTAVEERGLIHRFGQWSVLHQKQVLLLCNKARSSQTRPEFAERVLVLLVADVKAPGKVSAGQFDGECAAAGAFALDHMPAL